MCVCARVCVCMRARMYVCVFARLHVIAPTVTLLRHFNQHHSSLSCFLSVPQDDFDTLRPLCYPGTDVFLLCFSVVSPTSFHNVLEKWVPEIRHHCPRAPLVVVGTQSDLRNDVKVLIELAKYKEKPVSEEDAAKLADQLGAPYVECSALTQKNLKEVFDTGILTSLHWTHGELGKGLRKSKRSKSKDSTANTVLSADRTDPSLKKGGWKKFCCFM